MLRRSHLLPAVLCAAGLLWGLGARAPLLLDDLDELHYVQGFSSVRQCFGPDGYGLLRPIKNLLFWSVLHLPAPQAMTAHALSGALFLSATLMLFAWLRLWHPASRLPLAGAAIWSLAPTMVSSVVWFSCANILLCTVALLGALCFQESAQRCMARGQHRQGVLRLVAGGFLFALAFFSYEVAIVFPVLVLLQDLAFRRKVLSRTFLSFYASLGGLAVLLLAIRWAVCSGATPDNPGFAPLSGTQLAFSSAFFLMDHLVLWALPFGRQEILGTFVPGASASPLQIAASWFALLSSLGLSAACLRRSPRLALGGLWAIVTLLPTSNFLPTRTGPFADYYLVLPGIGITFLILELLRVGNGLRVASPLARILFAALVAVVVAWRASAAVTAFAWMENWNDPATLYRASLLARTQAYRARTNLARCLIEEGKLDEAEHLALQSRLEAPWYAMTYNILGDIRNKRGEHGAARDFYMQAVTNGVADDYTHYALAYTSETWLNDSASARTHYAIVTAEGRRSFYREQAFGNLARLLGIGGDDGGAIRLLQRGLSEFPLSIEMHHNIAVAYDNTGQRARAKTHRREEERLRRLSPTGRHGADGKNE